MKLQEQYKQVCEEYVKLFEQKQNLCFDYWVANDVGRVACFSSDFFFSFDDMRHDIDTEQKAGLIIDWHDESVENQDTTINYYSYTKGLRFEDLKK